MLDVSERSASRGRSQRAQQRRREPGQRQAGARRHPRAEELTAAEEWSDATGGRHP